MIPEHIAENYQARIDAGEDALAMAEQFVRDGYHELAEWARGRAAATGSAPDAPVETAKDKTPVETATPPAKA